MRIEKGDPFFSYVVEADFSKILNGFYLWEILLIMAFDCNHIMVLNFIIVQQLDKLDN